MMLSVIQDVRCRMLTQVRRVWPEGTREGIAAGVRQSVMQA